MLEQALSADITAEQALLGACIFDATIVDMVEPIVGQGEVFYRAVHQAIWQAILALRKRGEPVDLVTVIAELDRVEGRLDSIGGRSYLIGLLDAVPIVRHETAEQYARIVRSHHVRRRLQMFSRVLAQEAADGTKEPLEVQDRAIQTLLEIGREGDDGGLSASSQAELSVALVAAGKLEPDPGLLTGFASLDEAVGGLTRGALHIIAARPGKGKTALALNIAHRVRMRGQNVAVFSLEMAAEALAERRVCLEARVDGMRIRKARLTEAERVRVMEAVDRIRDYPLLVDATPALTSAQIAARARRAHAKARLGLIVVDYLQLINEPKDRTETRAQVVGKISKALKALAKTLNVPVLALSQLNRAPEMRADKRPTLADLRESGELEQDAEQVWLLHRDPARPQELEVVIAKHRNGPADHAVRLRWVPEHQRIDDLEWRHEDPENPAQEALPF
jgi:replicative DNA helicase